MAIKISEVRAALEPEEPDYISAAKMGREIVPHLKRLVKSGDPEMASKAASLAGLLGDGVGLAVLQSAAESADPIVRVAAAGAVQGLSDADASDVLVTLVMDTDLGVQKRALMSVPANPSADLDKCLSDITRSGDIPDELSGIIHGIVAAGESDYEMGAESLVSDMPPLDDESIEYSPDRESEMPGVVPTDDFEGSIEQEMPGAVPHDQEEHGKTQKMPPLDDGGDYYFDPETLAEMPS
jgi:hypothetical protein